MWRHYYQNTDILIFVVDSNDRERISEAADELQRFISEDELQDCILLVLANKQDLPNAMSVEEVTEKLRLNSLKDKNWCKSHASVVTFYDNGPLALATGQVSRSSLIERNFLLGYCKVSWYFYSVLFK